MIYDQTTGALYANDGAFLKTVSCPLALRADQLQRKKGSDRECSACNKTIRSIDDLTDEEMRDAIGEDPLLCVFSTGASRNIVFLQPWGQQESNWEHLPVVQTLRSLEAMATAHSRNFHLVLKDVGPEHAFGEEKYIVFRHRGTGQ